MTAYVVSFAEHVDSASTLRVDVLPPRLRRGISMHQRLVVDLLARLVDETTRTTVRIVHGSEFGELETAVVLATATEPAPARFSTSVHSSAIGLASIAFGNRRGHTTLSAGSDTLSACLVEAIGSLTAEDDVVVVIADEACVTFEGQAADSFSFGIRLSRTRVDGAARISLVPDDGSSERPTSLLDACRRCSHALRAGGFVAPSRPGFPSIRIEAGGSP